MSEIRLALKESNKLKTTAEQNLNRINLIISSLSKYCYDCGIIPEYVCSCTKCNKTFCDVPRTCFDSHDCKAKA